MAFEIIHKWQENISSVFDFQVGGRQIQIYIYLYLYLSY